MEKKNPMCKFVSLMLMTALVIMCTILVPGKAFADDVKPDNNEYEAHIYGVDVPGSGSPESDIFTINAIGECNGGPHDMLSHGWGDIINASTNKTVVSRGACHQCTKCHLVIITEGEPGTGKALKHYTTWQPHEALTSYVTVIRQSPGNIHYTSSSSIPGIRFRY